MTTSFYCVHPKRTNDDDMGEKPPKIIQKEGTHHKNTHITSIEDVKKRKRRNFTF